jgi:zinc transport system substrate-binding protein
MKNKFAILIIIMFLIIGGGIGVTALMNKGEKKDGKEITIVTTFYPMYTITANLISGVDNINLVNMTESATGCLHDYQVTTNDMKKLENADILVMNGGGMESFMDDIIKSYPDLTIIDASKGIELIEGEEESEEANGSEELVEEANAHVWLNMNKYEQQIENVKNGLISKLNDNNEQLKKNGEEYEEKIRILKTEMEESLKNPVNNKVIIFHDSFSYLAEELGLEVPYAVEIEADSSLSAGDIAKVIDEIKKNEIKVLLTEKQYGDAIAKSIANETDAKVYTIDSLVTGELDKDSYINGMRNNLEVLKEALYQ